MFANHPFTIASRCPDASEESRDQVPFQPHEMTFLVRRYGGTTRKIMNYEGRMPYGMVDGPYGGIARPLHLLYDNIVLVGGGGGVSALLPWLEELSLRMFLDPRGVRLARLMFVWCIRDLGAISWIERELRALTSRLPAEALEVLIYVTSDARRETFEGSIEPLFLQHSEDPDPYAIKGDEERSLPGFRSRISDHTTRATVSTRRLVKDPAERRKSVHRLWARGHEDGSFELCRLGSKGGLQGSLHWCCAAYGDVWLVVFDLVLVGSLMRG